MTLLRIEVETLALAEGVPRPQGTAGLADQIKGALERGLAEGALSLPGTRERTVGSIHLRLSGTGGAGASWAEALARALAQGKER